MDLEGKRPPAKTLPAIPLQVDSTQYGLGLLLVHKCRNDVTCVSTKLPHYCIMRFAEVSDSDLS
jgi:hypothetical protein